MRTLTEIEKWERQHRRLCEHAHVCGVCDQEFTAWWVWDGWPYMDGCCCGELICKSCLEVREDEQI